MMEKKRDDVSFKNGSADKPGNDKKIPSYLGLDDDKFDGLHNAISDLFSNSPKTEKN